jgi:hypothetical protein
MTWTTHKNYDENLGHNHNKSQAHYGVCRISSIIIIFQ